MLALIGLIAALAPASHAQTLTPLQSKIVAAANAEAGMSSGPSYVTSPWGTSAPWLTDAAGGDGARMRMAINRYYQWYWSSPRLLTLAQVKASMANDLGSNYDAQRKQMLVDEMVKQYGAAVARYRLRVQPPQTDQAMLSFLGVRKQCLEWANAISLSNGGGARGYGSPSISNPDSHRPGMMISFSSPRHAAIIVEISNGSPRRYRVAEANWGTGWMNPAGSIPWQRTVQNSRWVTLGAADTVISFE